MHEHRDVAGVIAPPPVLFLGFLTVGIAIDRLMWRLPIGLSATLAWPAAAALFVAGLALIVGAGIRFRRDGTPPAPWKPTSAIVAAGPYRFTRNPMYLGMAAIYLAIALALDSLPALLLFVPLMVVVDLFVVRREERYLEARFGDGYRTYKSEARRWL
ncbi:methyltransferase family protein [Hansschlegelia zhihuaiae]|uniref:methyltransferase family protein n=1 Tax=Hansschlegelia zhihuaiae TaxID=405005 RepID=UPI0013E8E9B2|nr:isoprenylcysteine carboxylmethyltransferase family protein [Hansschlegelia zhihuaiae]